MLIINQTYLNKTIIANHLNAIIVTPTQTAVVNVATWLGTCIKRITLKPINNVMTILIELKIFFEH